MSKTQFMQKRVCGNVISTLAALILLKGHGIKARTNAHAGITHFPNQCIIRTWKSLSLRPHALKLSPDDAPCWEICEFHMSMDSCCDTNDCRGHTDIDFMKTNCRRHSVRYEINLSSCPHDSDSKISVDL